MICLSSLLTWLSWPRNIFIFFLWLFFSFIWVFNVWFLCYWTLFHLGSANGWGPYIPWGPKKNQTTVGLFEKENEVSRVAPGEWSFWGEAVIGAAGKYSGVLEFPVRQVHIFAIFTFAPHRKPAHRPKCVLQRPLPWRKPVPWPWPWAAVVAGPVVASNVKGPKGLWLLGRARQDLLGCMQRRKLA